MASFIPLSFRLVRKKQTTGLATTFSLFLVIAGTFWVIYASLLHTQLLEKGATITDATTASVPIILTNIVGITTNGINLVVKYQMVSGAKKNNLTEQQYCDLIHEKKLQKKELDKLQK